MILAIICAAVAAGFLGAAGWDIVRYRRHQRNLRRLEKARRAECSCGGPEA